MIKRAMLACLIIALLAACKKDISSPTEEKNYAFGKNRFTTQVDGDTREYYVHVPTKYDRNTPTPVVIMLHGTTGDGERFYNSSGWKEVGEVENILTVYPSSWHYCIIDEGEVKNTTKWHSYPGSFDFCAGEKPRDDVKFLYQVIAEVKNLFNVDAKRVYLVGFSNGGQMAFRCAVEMSDVLAAVVEASGSVGRDTTAVPKRYLPITMQLGNSDDLWLDSATASVPMSHFEMILRSDPSQLVVVHSHTSTFHYGANYTMSGDSNTVLVATYPAIPATANREFKMLFIKDLDHEYPNGINHWFRGAEQHWAWFKQFRLP